MLSGIHRPSRDIATGFFAFRSFCHKLAETLPVIIVFSSYLQLRQVTVLAILLTHWSMIADSAAP
jgi:hypothetical protein